MTCKLENFVEECTENISWIVTARKQNSDLVRVHKYKFNERTENNILYTRK